MTDRTLPVIGAITTAIRASFRRRLAAALIAVLLIVSVSIVGLYLDLGGLLHRDVEQSMTAATTAEAHELTEWNRRNTLVTRALSDAPVFESGNETATRNYLRTQRSKWPSARITNTAVIDLRNRTVAVSTDRSLEGTPIAALPWGRSFSFREYDDVRSIGTYEGANGRMVVAYVTPIRREPSHLLVVVIDATDVFDRTTEPVDGSSTFVVDSNGTVVFADDDSAILQQYRDTVLRAPVVSAGLHGESGFVTDPSYERAPGREDLVAAYAPVHGTDWVVVKQAPADRAYAVVTRARHGILAIGGLALVGLLAVVVVLGSDVDSALSRLGTRAERLEDGEYDVQFDTDRSDEFGDLHRTLAATRDTLQRRFRELRDTKQDLEASNEALAERSTMVEVLNRVLRHNVRNEVNVIAGWAESVAAETEDERQRERLEIIQRKAWRLASLSNRTRRIQNLVSEGTGERCQFDLADRLRRELERVTSSHPDATVTVETPEGASSSVEAVTMLPVAVADVVEDILTNNDGVVDVVVTVSRDGAGSDGTVVLTVHDDGAGLPGVDTRTIAQGEVTSLDHADGLGLWCLKWTVERSGGDLSTESTDATLRLRVPGAGEP